MTKVEVELIETSTKVLTHWASVSRTLDNIENLLLSATFTSEEDKANCQLALDELQELHQPLDELHRQWRAEYWKFLAKLKAVKDTINQY